ncbi:hypothetical protein BC827DRAFT_1154638 [Russula dissimulans]|nr:hypothetical protein BC827DRAFT_1154638 [Russula dissimulans]
MSLGSAVPQLNMGIGDTQGVLLWIPTLPAKNGTGGRSSEACCRTILCIQAALSSQKHLTNDGKDARLRLSKLPSRMSHAFNLLPNGKRRKLTHLDVANPGSPSEEQKSVSSSQENDAFIRNGWEGKSIFDWEDMSSRPVYESREASPLPDAGATEHPQCRKRSLSELSKTPCGTSYRTEVWVTMQKTWAHGQDPHSLPGEKEDNNDTDNEDSEGGEEGGWDDDDDAESDATSGDDATLVLAELTSDCGQYGG